jgi:hypothetical protein
MRPKRVVLAALVLTVAASGCSRGPSSCRRRSGSADAWGSDRTRDSSAATRHSHSRNDARCLSSPGRAKASRPSEVMRSSP